MTRDADRLRTGLEALVRRLEEERGYLEQRLAFVRREIADLRGRLSELGNSMSDRTVSNDA